MSLRTFLETQRLLLNRFFDAIDIEAMQAVFEKLRTCTGVILLTGVGKSGYIAQKIAATLASTGTRAIFLSPVDALHGDIGFVTANDLVLFFSKSGESQELLDVLPYVQQKGAYTIAVVSQPQSRLARRTHLSAHLPVERELCPFDLVPTLSTTVQLLFGDCLAMALMQDKQFSVNDFAKNHPAGLLGRKITMKVADLMLSGDALPTCKEADRLLDVLHELTAKRCGCILICDEKKELRGIFTDGDLRRAIQRQGPEALQRSISEIMTPCPLAVSPMELAMEAIRRMEENPSRLVTVLPVVEQGKVVGLLRMHDMIQAGLR